MFEVSIQLLCTRKSGTLSRIIREIKLFGLQYQSHKIKYNAGQSQIIVNSTGDLNCTLATLEELFGSLPEVLKVEKLNVSKAGKEITEFKIVASEAHIAAQERISPAIILAAEKRLSEILGPVASLIVGSTARNCRNAGELYTRLAEELDDQNERETFLSVIEKS